MGFESAIIDWIPFDQGGRHKPPTGEEPPLYWAVVKFINKDSDAQPPTNGWSLEVRLIELLDGPYRWFAHVRFRVEAAPHHLLVEGAKFELYEGKRRVAIGVVSKN